MSAEGTGVTPISDVYGQRRAYIEICDAKWWPIIFCVIVRFWLLALKERNMAKLWPIF